MTLRGKHALVTGSSRGIGRGIALALAERGARVAVHYFENKTAANQTLDAVRQRGSNGFLVQGDVTRPDEVRRIFRTVEAEFQRLDVFVSNARPELPFFYEDPLHVSEEAWDTALASQAKAFLLGVRESIRTMPSGGRIIAVTYAPGARTGSRQPWIAMGAAKAALDAACRYFAVALAKRGITVNAVSPGLTEDSVLNSLPADAQRAARQWHESGWTPIGRLGTPADIGHVVALLCSEDAHWITGQTIHADGGASLMDTVLPLHMQQPAVATTASGSSRS